MALLEPARAAGHKRIALIGIPCQVHALRAEIQSLREELELEKRGRVDAEATAQRLAAQLELEKRGRLDVRAVFAPAIPAPAQRSA